MTHVQVYPSYLTNYSAKKHLILLEAINNKNLSGDFKLNNIFLNTTVTK